MMNSHAQRLAFAVAKASARREYLAYYLAQYQKEEKLTDESIMDFVACSGEAYYRLALCQVPDLRASDFRQRLERIAAYTGACAGRIAQVIRHVASIEALRIAPQLEQWHDAACDQGRPTSGDTPPPDLAQDTLALMDAAHRDRRAAASRSPTRSALLAARDRDEPDEEAETANDSEPENEMEE